MSIVEDIQLAVKSLRQDVPDCVASGVVDMDSGMLLAVETLDSHPQEILDLVAAATYDLFQGKNVVAIEEMFKQSRGVAFDGHYFKEMIVTSENLLHIFMRGQKQNGLVAVAVCRASANLGLVLTTARKIMKELDA